MVVEIRAASASDEDRRALALVRRRWTEEDDGGPIDDPTFEARAVDWIERNQSHRLGWLAWDDDVPVGMIVAIIFERMPQPGRDDSGWGYVHHLVVLPSYRDQGIGGRLLSAVVEEAERRGWDRLLLHPRERSIPFYERAGFVPGDMFLVRELRPTPRP
jgi:GNAT superfamily N-acetyltransferase